jgi:colicin import membrane protein
MAAEEAKRIATEAAKRKAAAEAKRIATEAAKRKAEAETKRKAAEEAKRKASEEAKRQLSESLERERRNRFIRGQVEQYASLIKTRVEQNWRLPQGSRHDSSCLLKITLTPEGRVLNVSVVQSSGDSTFDQSAIAAVYRASPLPVPSAPEAMAVFRSFNFKFYPGG